MKIDPFRYYFDHQDIEFITTHFAHLLREGGYLTMGEYGERFEREFADFCQLPHALAAHSGTSALEMIFLALEVAGKEVIVPTNTFTATAVAAIKAGAKVIFADILPDMCIDPEDVRKKITAQTAAVVTVHLGGHISPSTLELVELCRRQDLALVEDAAHAHGSLLNDKSAGHFGRAAAFSFFSTKVMTTGEGGMVVTRDQALWERMRLLRNHGQIEDNQVAMLGYNWRLPEVAALMGLTQLRRLDEFLEKRQQLARIYDGHLSDLPEVEKIQTTLNGRHSYYKYILRLKKHTPAFVQKLLKEEFQVRLGGFVYPIPCHRQELFASLGQGPLPMAESLCSSHICLPLYFEMTAHEAHYVMDSLKKVLSS